MKLNRLTLPVGKEVIFHEDIDFSSYQGDPYHVRSIKSCHMDLSVLNYDELVVLSFQLKGEVMTTCAYTLEEIPYQYNIKESVELAGNEDDEFEIINETIDIDEILITLIVSNIPMKVVKKGAKLPSNGEGYQVMSEEEANNKKKASPFDALDDLEL